MMNLENLKLNLLKVVAIMALGIASGEEARAATIFFTSEASWLTQTSFGTTEEFLFTADNVALADEVSSPPAPNTFLGQVLTFQSGTIGLPYGLSFRNERPDLGNQVFFVNDSLGAAPVQEHDWSVSFIGEESVLEVGLNLSDITDPTVVWRVFNTSNVEVASFTGLTTNFLGVISDNPIGRILYDDTFLPGGAAVTGIVTPIPEPSSLLLFISGLSALISWRGRLLSSTTPSRA